MSPSLPYPLAAFVLAGGASTRMGREKARLEIAGQPVLLRTLRLLEPLAGQVAVIGPPDRFTGCSAPVLPDDQPGLGPLGGIATALRVTRHDWNLVLGCDLPYLTRAWLEYLAGRAMASTADAWLPAGERGPEPLCAAYHRRCREPIARGLARGLRKVTDALAGLRVEAIPPEEWKPFDPDGRLFKNMNTPEDYAEARAYFERQGAQ